MAGTILVLGGTGTVGAKLVNALRAKGEAVRTASRNPVADGEVRFDFSDAETFAEAFNGVDRVYMLSPAGYSDQVGTVSPVMQFAIGRKLKIVLQTAMGVDVSDAVPLRKLELILQKSGTPHVILRPNWFSDNFGSYWLNQVRAGMLRLPAADGRTSFVDARDIAASAAAALTSDRFDGQALDLTGPEAITYGQAAEKLSKTTGKTVSYTPVDKETFVSETVQAGVPPIYAGLLGEIFGYVQMGAAERTTDSVLKLTGTAPRTLDSFLNDNAAHLRG